MKRSAWLAAFFAIVGITLAACSGPATDTGTTNDTTNNAQGHGVHFPLTYDNCGKKITINAMPKRVLTIGTPAVDLLGKIGASDKIVARAGEYGVPATGPAGTAVADKPIIDDQQPTLEKILGAGVDLVVGYGPGKTTAEDLAGVGVPIYVLSAYCGPHGGGTGDGGQLTDIVTDMTFLGGVLGIAPKADAAAQVLQKRVDAIRSARPAGALHTAAAIYFLGAERYSYSDQAIMSDQMKMLGLTNTLAGIDQDSALNVEAFIGSKPDVIVLIYGYEPGDTFEKVKQKLLAIPGVNTMSAVVHNRIVGVTGPEVEASPIAVDGLERMAAELQAG